MEPIIETTSYTAGTLIVSLITSLEENHIQSVYLRNYEKLPEEVGNDVDLLVPAGQRKLVADTIVTAARQRGWHLLNISHFSPIAVYLANLETGETLHIDIFDRLEWHFIEYADAARTIANRRKYGAIMIPAQEDEISLNLLTRLVYQGAIREKHRIAARDFVENEGRERLRQAFNVHLGSGGNQLFDLLLARYWVPQASDRRLLLSCILLKHGLWRPYALFQGGIRYLMRTLRKIVRPPGKLIVLEGADGVGKSTILDVIRPWCAEWCAGREPYGFHWKPVKVTKQQEASAPVNPRASGSRRMPASLAYLIFHILGFWWGWFFKIRPLLVKSHAVIGDRYSFDLFMDPERFRLGLPLWLCKCAALMVPKPAVTVGLVANPVLVHARKPELTVNEIDNYQNRWRILSEGCPSMVTVQADGPPEEVVLHVKQEILKSLISHGR